MVNDLGLKDWSWSPHDTGLDDWDNLLSDDWYLNPDFLVLSADNWLWHTHNFGDLLVDLSLDWDDLLVVLWHVFLNVDWLLDWNLNLNVDWHVDPLDYWVLLADLNFVWDSSVDWGWDHLLVAFLTLSVNNLWTTALWNDLRLTA